MHSRLRWWLFGILALTIVALLSVLRPITLKERVNPDTQQKITPISTLGPFKLYAPYPDLRLGLDLRGGMQLRLQLQKAAVFTYDVPEVSKLKASEERSALQGEIGELLSQKLSDVKRSIRVTETGVEITTDIKDENEMKRLAVTIDEVLTARFPDAKALKPEFVELKPGQLSEVQSILESRINTLGVAEPIFQSEPPDKILVEIPGVRDPEQAKELLRASAVLEFRAIPARYIPAPPAVDPRTQEEEVTQFQRKLAGGGTGEVVPAQKVLDESDLLLTGKDLKSNADVSIIPGQETGVSLEFKPNAVKTWADYTMRNVGNFVAVVLDGKIISCPRINEAIPGGHTLISGGFNTPEGAKRANSLKIKLNAGALPVSIVPVEEREVSATLGEDSLRNSLLAGAVGFAVILIFMIWYYKLPGILACAALIIYFILLMAALKALGATLTLPGIFGVILSIGMAVDANIIIFERLKEEIRAGKTMRAAIDAGFKRAWTAILDSNICSILTGLVLYWLGTGPIKGFAITLIVGVAVSMFTAITVTRLFMDLAAVSGYANKPSAFGVPESQLERAR